MKLILRGMCVGTLSVVMVSHYFGIEGEIVSVFIAGILGVLSFNKQQ